VREAAPLVRRIETLIEPALEGLGFRCVRVRFAGRDRRTLEVMVERIDERPVGVEDCARASETLSTLLDVEDPIGDAYTLEVSSPGIDRPLVKPDDFERFAGFEAVVEMKEPVSGRRRFRGRLEGAAEGRVRLALPEGRIELAFEAIAQAKLVLTDELLAHTRGA